MEAIRPYEKIFGIDKYNGHVDHRGLYHYHKSNSLLLLNGKTLIGYAADGFEILYIPNKVKSSWQLKKGREKLNLLENMTVHSKKITDSLKAVVI